MNLLMILKKIGVFKLSELVFKVGATVWTADKLYLFVFRDVIESRKDLDSRTKNDLRAMVNGLLGYEEQVKEYMIAKATESLEKALEGGKVDLISINPTETPEEAAMKWALETQKTNLNEPEVLSYVESPSIESVKNGSDVIELGDKGGSVKEIQKMLYDIGYEDYITDFQTISDWNNGEFNEAMKFSVEIFQEDNKLKSDGIIDKITINKIMDIYSNINMYARQ
jgi:murein L,D-transpeptidase YcbB/YkuD